MLQEENLGEAAVFRASPGGEGVEIHSLERDFLIFGIKKFERQTKLLLHFIEAS